MSAQPQLKIYDGKDYAKLPEREKGVYAIYFDSDITKIGKTSFPRRRISNLIVGFPAKPVQIGFVPCLNYSKIENIIHKTLASTRINGEFFSSSFDSFIEIIKSLESELKLTLTPEEIEKEQIRDEKATLLGEALEARLAYAQRGIIKTIDECEKEIKSKTLEDKILSSFASDYFREFPEPQLPLRRFVINERNASYVSDTISFLYWKRLYAPPLTEKKLIKLIQTGEIEGFRDERIVFPKNSGWLLYQDSLMKWINEPRSPIKS